MGWLTTSRSGSHHRAKPPSVRSLRGFPHSGIRTRKALKSGVLGEWLSSQKWTCIRIGIVLYLVSVRCDCMGGYVVFYGHVLTCTGLIYCNAWNNIEQPMQVPMYSLRGFCPLSGWLPNWFQACTLMGFMVAIESALRPQAYFGPGLSTQASGFTTPW